MFQRLLRFRWYRKANEVLTPHECLFGLRKSNEENNVQTKNRVP